MNATTTIKCKSEKQARFFAECLSTELPEEASSASGVYVLTTAPRERVVDVLNWVD